MGLTNMASYIGINASEIVKYRKCQLCEKLFDSTENLHALEKGVTSGLLNWTRWKIDHTLHIFQTSLLLRSNRPIGAIRRILFPGLHNLHTLSHHSFSLSSFSIGTKTIIQDNLQNRCNLSDAITCGRADDPWPDLRTKFPILYWICEMLFTTLVKTLHIRWNRNKLIDTVTIHNSDRYSQALNWHNICKIWVAVGWKGSGDILVN